MEKSRSRSQETRKRLLEAAVPLIGEVGWSSVTTRLVAERAGVAPGVVHYHFSSVTDLLSAAAMGFIEAMLAELRAGLAAQQDPDELVGYLMGALSAFGGSDPASLLITETYLAATRVPELRERLGAVIVDFRGGVADWLRAHADTPHPDAAAALLTAAMDGLVLQRGLDPALDLTGMAPVLRAMLA